MLGFVQCPIACQELLYVAAYVPRRASYRVRESDEAPFQSAASRPCPLGRFAAKHLRNDCAAVCGDAHAPQAVLFLIEQLHDPNGRAPVVVAPQQVIRFVETYFSVARFALRHGERTFRVEVKQGKIQDDPVPLPAIGLHRGALADDVPLGDFDFTHASARQWVVEQHRPHLWLGRAVAAFDLDYVSQKRLGTLGADCAQRLIGGFPSKRGERQEQSDYHSMFHRPIMCPEREIFQSILQSVAAMNCLSMSLTTFEFSSRSENLAPARAFVREFLKSEGIPEKESEALVLGVDEACSNVIRHAYGERPPSPISLSCERLGDVICFRLRDFGAQVDPSLFNRRSLDQVKPGGLGLYLIEHIFDEAVYNPQPLGTELVLLKRLG